MRIILVYEIYLYLLVNTFYMVSNTKNKCSESLNFHPILSINYTHSLQQYGENADKNAYCVILYLFLYISLPFYTLYIMELMLWFRNSST